MMISGYRKHQIETSADHTLRDLLEYATEQSIDPTVALTPQEALNLLFLAFKSLKYSYDVARAGLRRNARDMDNLRQQSLFEDNLH